MKSRTLGQANMPFSALEFPVVASIKYDGRNTKVVVDEYGVNYYTSGDKHFTLENNEPFDSLPDGVYYAEMMGADIEGKLGDRIYSGIQTTMYTNTSKGIPNRQSPTWKIFYYVEHDEHRRGKSYTNYYSMLKDISDIPDASIEYKLCNDLRELMEYYHEVIEDGWEGLMVAQPDLKWEDSTSRLKTFVKMKEVPTIKGRVAGFQVGEGKYTGMIGALSLRLESNKIVKVGSGLTDQLRSKDFDSYFKDKIVEIAYEQLIDGIPQQPRYKGLRESF